MIATKAPSKSHIRLRKWITPGFAGKAGLLFLLLAPAAFGNNEYRPHLEGAIVEKYKTVGDVSLNLWIFNPKNHKPTDHRAAILFFFGGGWMQGSPEQFKLQCQHLAEHGMVAITVDYRVGSRNHVKPVQCVADVKSAMRWVRTNAVRLGIDPQRIAAGGGSAGGHLAACTAFIKDFDAPGEDTSVSAVPNALVLFNPALVLAPLYGYQSEGKGKITEWRMGTKPENISPAHHIYKGAPPTIIFHGKADTTVPYITAEAFTAEMIKAGNRCELAGYEGANHSFFNTIKWRDDTIKRMDQFLKSLGYLDNCLTPIPST